MRRPCPTGGLLRHGTKKGQNVKLSVFTLWNRTVKRTVKLSATEMLDILSSTGLRYPRMWGRAGWLQSSSGRFRGDISLLYLSGLQPRTVQPIAQSLYRPSFRGCLSVFSQNLVVTFAFHNLTKRPALFTLSFTRTTNFKSPKHRTSHWAMRVFIYLALGHAVHQLPHKMTHKFRSRGWYSHILFAKPRAQPSPLKPAII